MRSRIEISFKALTLALFWVLLVFFPLSLPAVEDDFPRSESLLPAINFWIQVYTQADTESGFLHDSRNLGVIYAKLPRNSQVIEVERERIKADLRLLASGQRTNLTTRQQQLLQLWGNQPDSVFAKAAEEVRWQLGQSNRFREGLIRSGAYRTHILSILEEMKMPKELLYLPHIESSFHPGASSSVAATGMWQFMRTTGQRFMRVDREVDERLDPYTSARAAMGLLQENYLKLGTWPLALTAYNHGANGMARAVKAMGTSDMAVIISNYTGPRFGFASRNFYAQFLAIMEIERDITQYFSKVEMASSPQFKSAALKGFANIVQLSAGLQISVQQLRKANPALLPVIWSGQKRVPSGYQLKVFAEDLAGDLQLSLDALPAQYFYKEQIPDVSYTVRTGDTLSGIARMFGTSIAELAAINQLRNRNQLRVGQLLILPSEGRVPDVVVNGAPVVQIPTSYVVRRGDTVAAIANRFGLNVSVLIAQNGLDNEATIYVGQLLNLTLPEVYPTPTVDSITSPLDEGPQDLYSVNQSQSITVLSDETVGHYAEWLKVTSAALLKLNNLRNPSSLRLGDSFKLDLTKVNKLDFSQSRRLYHLELHNKYMSTHRIVQLSTYIIKPGDALSDLLRKNKLPLWLFQQYNPDIAPSVLNPGDEVLLPIVSEL
jgi:membrane-bound lytic murein transglycosylase D